MTHSGSQKRDQRAKGLQTSPDSLSSKKETGKKLYKCKSWGKKHLPKQTLQPINHVDDPSDFWEDISLADQL